MERKKGKVMGKWGDESLHGRRKRKVMGEGAEGDDCRRWGGCRKRLIAWEKKRESDGQVGERKEKEKEKKRKWVAALGFGLGHENGGERWAMMGWNWSWTERNGLG